jgi:P pilus assembly chaperone PapD
MRARQCLMVCLALIASIYFGLPPPDAQAVSVEIGPVELRLEPGEEYVGSISVTNPDSEPVTLRVYLGDWKQTEEGEQYLDVGEEERSLSKWMRVTPSYLTVPPEGSEKIYYEIKVPEDEDKQLAGSYWGIFFVEAEPNPGEPVLSGKPEATLGLKIVMRHGVKVYVTIPGTERRKAEFIAARTEESDGGLNIFATFENQGNTYLRPDVWLELRDSTGTTVYSIDHGILSVLPGISRDYEFELIGVKLPPGRYIALVIADYGALSLIGAQVELEVQAE